MKTPKHIAESELNERIVGALMDYHRATGEHPRRIEIEPVFGADGLEGYHSAVDTVESSIEEVLTNGI
jgi:hypothetical protein